MSFGDPRRDGTLEQRLEYWEERLANAEMLGKPGHIEVVRNRVEPLRTLVGLKEQSE